MNPNPAAVGVILCQIVWYAFDLRLGGRVPCSL
jgi:hypothetical protein